MHILLKGSFLHAYGTEEYLFTNHILMNNNNTSLEKYVI